jgi:hypothetical protein
MRESIFSTWTLNLSPNPLIIAGYVLQPQVPTYVEIFKYSDLKNMQKYATINVIRLADNPATSGEKINNVLSLDTPSNLNTISEVASQLTFTKKLLASDFSETGTGTGKWKTIIEHNFGRIPDVKVIADNSIINGDILHGENLNYFVVTLSQRIPCTVHLS